MGKTIMESLVEFVGEGQITHLQHVYLVIFEAKMVEPEFSSFVKLIISLY
jgi:hypothetical protein